MKPIPGLGTDGLQKRRRKGTENDRRESLTAPGLKEKPAVKRNRACEKTAKRRGGRRKILTKLRKVKNGKGCQENRKG